MKIKTVESFPTIDTCVAYLESIGCTWNNDKEVELKEKRCFKHNGVLVLFDPSGLFV